MEEKSEKRVVTVTPLLIGTGQALVLSLLLSLVIVTTLFFTSVSEYYVAPFVQGAFGVCAFWAGLVTARRAGSRGLIYGLLAGLVFFLITSLGGYFLPEVSFPMTEWWKKLAYALVGGITGGVVGVAWKK
ncbi:TIGR04086 family membrane protein [Heliorestis acidaminivorans]|uniref:TIGR04086 family membrane protein n=1 Tax=Heliorestis acidaminivorans TaxID=553427 RepID=UPI001479436E|nr:TIGR04086 family membrane protein [Heliorestis acidaminivorans]